MNSIKVKLVHNANQNRKSVDVDSSSELHQILTKIQKELSTLPRYQPPFNDKFHVELVDDAKNVSGKEINYCKLHDKHIDLTQESSWDRVGGAYCLILADADNFHKSPYHITIGYFGAPHFCKQIEESAYIIVKEYIARML